MQKKNILISVIDGQGGGIGRQYISALTSVLPKDLPVTIRALGTNSLATSNMLKGGANDGATGENAIVLNAGHSDIIVGVVAIVVANAILGELTPTMAQAIGAQQCPTDSDSFRQLQYPYCHAVQRPLQALYRPGRSHDDGLYRRIITIN